MQCIISVYLVSNNNIYTYRKEKRYFTSCAFTMILLMCVVCWCTSGIIEIGNL